MPADRCGVRRSRHAVAARRAGAGRRRAPTVTTLLDHHHDAGQLLVGERREAEQPHGLVDVGREERPEVEQDHVRHDLARPEDERRVAEALVQRQAVVARRVDDLRPHEQAADDEAQVHQVVPEAVVQRGLVEARDVPGRRGRGPRRRSSCPGGAGTAAALGASRPGQAARAGRAAERRPISGPRTATTVSAMPRSAMRTCWSMCTLCRYRSPIASIGEMMARTVTVTPATKSGILVHGARSARRLAEPSPAVDEERDRDEAAADHDGLERPGTPQVLGRERSTHERRLARVSRARGRRVPLPDPSESRPPCACGRRPRGRCTPSGSARPGG